MSVIRCACALLVTPYNYNAHARCLRRLGDYNTNLPNVQVAAAVCRSRRHFRGNRRLAGDRRICLRDGGQPDNSPFRRNDLTQRRFRLIRHNSRNQRLRFAEHWRLTTETFQGFGDL